MPELQFLAICSVYLSSNQKVFSQHQNLGLRGTPDCGKRVRLLEVESKRGHRLSYEVKNPINMA